MSVMELTQSTLVTMKIIFESDQVKVKSGHKVDNSAEVTFVVGEYQLQKIKALVGVIDANIRVTVEIDD